MSILQFKENRHFLCFDNCEIQVVQQQRKKLAAVGFILNGVVSNSKAWY
jgi:hypothetical protein